MNEKMIPVENLPDGYYKERISTMVIDTKATVPVVAKPGYNNDWACYIGWPKLGELKKEEVNESTLYYTTALSSFGGTLSNGDKLSEREARQIFPEHAELKYRP